MYREFIYENSKGDRLYLNKSSKAFLFDVSGMGYKYNNSIVATEYDTVMDIQAVDISQEAISGLYLISGSNERIYTTKSMAEKILNYDQLLNRTRRKKVHGKLHYRNANGRKVYAYVLVSEFRFGEIDEDAFEGLEVELSFDMITKNWISEDKKIYTLTLDSEKNYFRHPYGHAYGHENPEGAESKQVALEIGGNDVAYIIVRIYGPLSGFTLTLRSATETYNIKYAGEVPEGSTMVLDMIDMYAKVDGINCLSKFDIVNYDIPFFQVIPGNYSMLIGAENLSGKAQIEIYESWVSG